MKTLHIATSLLSIVLASASGVYAQGTTGVGTTTTGTVSSSGSTVSGSANTGVTVERSGTSADWDAQDRYWRETYPSRPYYNRDTNYDTYQPAYRYGAESYSRHQGKRFDEVEADLRAGWERTKEKSRLTWERAKDAVRDAYERMANRMDTDNDGTVGR